MENKERIKEKIKALLSKTIDNGATKQEMESALSKANQLMTAFFISEYDLKDDEVIEKCVLKQVEVTKTGFDLSLFYADLAFLFDCEHYFSSKKISFFGHEQDVELCCYFYNVITRTCLKEKEIYLKSDDFKRLKQRHHGRTLSSSFIKGFLVEVVYKMKEMYRDRKSNIPESYGLMVIEKIDKVKSEFKNLNNKIHYEKPKPLIATTDAFNSGSESGRQLNLIQGIESCEESNRFAIGF